MKFLFDLFPVLLFFIVYKLGDMNQAASAAFVQHYMGGMIAGGSVPADQAPMMVATLVAIVASLLQIGYVLARGRKVDMMLWISVIVIVIFGGATIYLHDDKFIKWKPTILHWLYALALLVAQVGFRKNLVREVMAEALDLPAQVWDRLCFAWIGYFFLVGAVNLLVAFVIFKDNTSSWVSFKAFGLTGMSFAFVILQSLYLSRYIKEDQA
jgi:intracellular septation protein